jgi:hypothetical protein
VQTGLGLKGLPFLRRRIELRLSVDWRSNIMANDSKIIDGKKIAEDIRREVKVIAV